MNHVQAQYITEEGAAIPYHSWEIRQGGYKWIALVLRGPYLASYKNKRLIDFLLEKYFKVYAPDIPEIGPVAESGTGTGGLKAYTANIEGFRAFIEKKESNKPVIPFVFSLSALPFLYYYFNVHTPFKAFALFSPILDFTGALFGSSFLFKKRLKMQFNGKSILSDTASERAGIEADIDRNSSVSRKLVKDLKKIASGFPGNLEMESAEVNAGIFYGEADSLISVSGITNLKEGLKSGKVSVFSYPRVKHILFYDKYWENTENDLSLFLSGLVF